MEENPTNRYQDYPNPKTLCAQRIGYPIPIINVNVFVRLTEKIKQGPGQNGSNPVDEEIQAS
jgi:hypothetical protein